jgi:hypothetical protein
MDFIVITKSGEMFSLKDTLKKSNLLLLGVAPSIFDNVTKATSPLIDLVEALSFPICFVSMGVGFIVYATGNKHKGMDIIKGAGVSYIGIQMLPGIFKVLHAIGAGLAAGW